MKKCAFLVFVGLVLGGCATAKMVRLNDFSISFDAQASVFAVYSSNVYVDAKLTCDDVSYYPPSRVNLESIRCAAGAIVFEVEANSAGTPNVATLFTRYVTLYMREEQLRSHKHFYAKSEALLKAGRQLLKTAKLALQYKNIDLRDLN